MLLSFDKLSLGVLRNSLIVPRVINSSFPTPIPPGAGEDPRLRKGLRKLFGRLHDKPDGSDFVGVGDDGGDDEMGDDE